MPMRPLIRDLVLVCFALAFGWWCRGAGNPVHAQRYDTANDPSVSFQIGPLNRDATLGIYNPSNHTVYVYPMQSGNSYINCVFSFRIGNPGAPIERQVCPAGQTYPH